MGRVLNLDDLARLQEDGRRARAAYPDLPSDQLYEKQRFDFEPLTVPASRGGWESESRIGPDGKSYLESAQISVVRAAYPKRANKSDADAYFSEKKEKKSADQLENLKRHGFCFGTFVPGDGRWIRCEPDAGCVAISITYNKRTASYVATRHALPFVPEEWINFNPRSKDDIYEIPSFELAKTETGTVEPSDIADFGLEVSWDQMISLAIKTSSASTTPKWQRLWGWMASMRRDR